MLKKRDKKNSILIVKFLLIILVFLFLLFLVSSYEEPMRDIKQTLPSTLGGSASIVWLQSNGKVYVSTNAGYLIELDENLNILRNKSLGAGRTHELTTDGTYIYVQADGNGGKVFKIQPTAQDLEIVALADSLGISGYSEGAVFLEGDMYASWSGSPGQIVRINTTNMTLINKWSLSEENHGLTTDGQNLFVLGVPTRGSTPDKYYKLSPSFNLLGTITFPWNGNLGGNIYFPPTDSVYTGAGKVTRINPNSFTITGNSSFSTVNKEPLHWLATDSNWIYAIDYAGFIRVFDPNTLEIVYTKNTGIDLLHYGIVQNGYLWVAGETVPGVIARYDLYQAPSNTSCVDNDLDSYNQSAFGCGIVDCNDNDIAINPGSAEICDGIDNNCDNTIDEGCLSNNTSQCSDSLVLYFPFDDGTANDKSGKNNNGIINGGAIWTPNGKIGGAFEFDGANDYISVSHNKTINLTNQGSLVLWAKQDAATISRAGFVQKGDSSNGYYFFNAKELGNGIARLTLRKSGSGDANYNSPTGYLVDGEWHQYIVAFNGTGVGWYKDGVLLENDLWINGAGSTTSILQIGRRSDVMRYFKGVMDEVAIFDRKLSAEEISSLYNSGICMPNSLCGNGIIDIGIEFVEDCDGTNLTQTCQDQGFASGNLSCTNQCTFNTSNCIAFCTDTDSDGYNQSAFGCGIVDCNDIAINPGSAEICDGIDNNCDNTIDEGCGTENQSCVNLNDPFLILYMSFNESNAADHSTKGNNGTIIRTTWAANRKSGGAFTFDRNDYINLGNPTSLNIANNMTITWPKTSTTGYNAAVAK